MDCRLSGDLLAVELDDGARAPEFTRYREDRLRSEWTEYADSGRGREVLLTFDVGVRWRFPAAPLSERSGVDDVFGVCSLRRLGALGT